MTAGDAWTRRHPAYRAVVRGWPARPLLACSGGIDSSALLVLAGIAASCGEIDPFVVVHVDHLTRPASADEADAVEQLADRFDLEMVRTKVDPSDATMASTSPEDRLRALRYSALARVAANLGRDTVVTAHTRDDQIETILLRLLSGAGGLAAAGMAEATVIVTASGPINVCRPLLAVGRDDLIDVLRRTDVLPFEDPTNRDQRFRRNVLRHAIIPRVATAFPGFESALIRSVILAARDAEALDSVAGDLMRDSVSDDEHSTRVDRSVLRHAHPAVASRIIRMAAGRLMPENRRELSFERVESVRLAVAGRSGAVIELPYDVVARIERTQVVFERRNQ